MACVIGWPDLVADALRPPQAISTSSPLTALISEGSGLVRGAGACRCRGHRRAGEAEAPLRRRRRPRPTFVLLEAAAVGPGRRGRHQQLPSSGHAVARTSGTPVWLTAGVGRLVPGRIWDCMVQRLDAAREPWDADEGRRPLELVDRIVGPDGPEDPGAARRRTNCPIAPELFARSLSHRMSRRDVIRRTDAEVDAFLAEPHSMNIATFNHDGTIHLVAMCVVAVVGSVSDGGSGRLRDLHEVAEGAEPPVATGHITALVEDGIDLRHAAQAIELVGEAEVPSRTTGCSWTSPGRWSPSTSPDVAEGDIDAVAEMMVLQAGGRALQPRPQLVSWDHTKLEGGYRGPEPRHPVHHARQAWRSGATSALASGRRLPTGRPSTAAGERAGRAPSAARAGPTTPATSSLISTAAPNLSSRLGGGRGSAPRPSASASPPASSVVRRSRTRTRSSSATACGHGSSPRTTSRPPIAGSTRCCPDRPAARAVHRVAGGAGRSRPTDSRRSSAPRRGLPGADRPARPSSCRWRVDRVARSRPRTTVVETSTTTWVACAAGWRSNHRPAGPRDGHRPPRRPRGLSRPPHRAHAQGGRSRPPAGSPSRRPSSSSAPRLRLLAEGLRRPRCDEALLGDRRPELRSSGAPATLLGVRYDGRCRAAACSTASEALCALRGNVQS